MFPLRIFVQIPTIEILHEWFRYFYLLKGFSMGRYVEISEDLTYIFKVLPELPENFFDPS